MESEVQREESRIRRIRRAKAEQSAGEGSPSLASALGNARVQRLMRAQAIRREAAGDGSGPVDDAVARAIQGKRGGGQGLDGAARRDLEPALGADFSNVRIHTDDEADSLNRAVQAEAFTTGNDIFFRKGNYDPGSSEGRALLAHELTHVVQQSDAPANQDMTVSSPEDASEREASAVAGNLAAPGPTATAAVSREEVKPEDEDQLKGAGVLREAQLDDDELKQA